MSVKGEVLELLAKILDVEREEIAEDKKLYEALGVDSTEMVEVVLAINKKFGTKITTNEITKFSTPVEIVKLIEEKLKK